MFNPLRSAGGRASRSALALLVATALLSAGTAIAFAATRTFTLKLARHAKVTDVQGKTTRMNVVTNRHGFVVYTLSGDSPRHPKCTSSVCLQFWPAVTVGSAKKPTKAPGISGKLAIWKHAGMRQVTINGHPLYTFSGDAQRDVATGEGIVSFGGTWHVRTASGTIAKAPQSTGSGPSSW